MKKSILLLALSFGIISCIKAQNDKKLVPLTQRVSIQKEIAKPNQIIDGAWVGVGTNKAHAIQKDYKLTFKGKPSYRFELKANDNTLEGYAKGHTKGRAELSYCYATADDIKGLDYATLQACKTVYHHGKGFCEQGSSWNYQFSINVPENLNSDVSTIFAQWHGMPSRTLVQTPEGVIKEITEKEFAEMDKIMEFKKNIGYDKIFVKDKSGKVRKDKNGNPKYKRAKKPNGWLVEQGGYPPLAFGFANGYFYIKANSDRKWMTDKTDRCNAGVDKYDNMESEKSTYKTSTIAYKMPYSKFPKNNWVTFKIHIDWTKYNKEHNNIIKAGMLDVVMSYEEKGKEVSQHIVDNEEILIGRNDECGYYFKFGIYRVGNSTVPTFYNLANYKEWQD